MHAQAPVGARRRPLFPPCQAPVGASRCPFAGTGRRRPVPFRALFISFIVHFMFISFIHFCLFQTGARGCSLFLTTAMGAVVNGKKAPRAPYS